MVAIGQYRIASVDRLREWWLQVGFCGIAGVFVWKGGPSTLVFLRLQILASSLEGVVFWFIVLLFCLFLLVLCFGSDFRSQINPCSFESRLLSRILAGVQF